MDDTVQNRLQLTPGRPTAAWGDREPPWVPETLGRRARTAEAAWKLDPDPAYPDTVYEQGRIGDVTVAAAAVRGAKHRYEGKPRQDSALARSAGGAWAVAAVADGVGSVDHSQVAAEAAVRLCIEDLARRLESSGADAFRQGRALFKHVNTRLERLQGPRTTLTVAAMAAKPDGDGFYPYWIARVGDSPAYVIDERRLIELFPLERDEDFSTVTAAMPTAALRDCFRERMGLLSPGQALALVSDGIGDLITTDGHRAARSGGPIADDSRDHFGERWSSAPDPLDFLRQTQLRRKSFDDDRSAAVFWTALPEHREPAPPLLPAGALPIGPTLPRDLELRAGRHGDIEVRAAVAGSDLSKASGIPRRSRILIAAHADRIVAIVAAPIVLGAERTVERWTSTLQAAVELMPPDQPSEDWTVLPWTHAVRTLRDDPEIHLDAIAAALICVEPTAGSVHYTLSLSGGPSALIAGDGIQQSLGEPRRVFTGTAGEPEMRLYADHLDEDKTLLLTYGLIPALIDRVHLRPGPLQTIDLLGRGTAQRERFAVVLWGER
ncbi:hypothetical protein GCM10009830_20620 [Glycomyces endophyticus]|uniref:PPM-type phosphatase domain-containing protein n=1 Tax=Glycomyces endophyticus TaxID=480996 RepID=A0ABP4SM85_9ACTN